MPDARLAQVAARKCMQDARPVKARAGIRLALRRNVAVTRNVAQRKPATQLRRERDEAIVLGGAEIAARVAFELDPDGKIVALRATTPA